MKYGKKCPRCAEWIKAEAIVCHYCSHEFSADEVRSAKQYDLFSKIIMRGIPAAILIWFVIEIAHYWPTPTDTSSTLATNTKASTPSPNPTPAANWIYSDEKDKLRGTTNKFAETASDNEVEMPFPYNGGVRGHIMIQRRRQDGLGVLFHVDKGQILCSDYRESRIEIKFDDGKVHSYGCDQPDTGQSEYAFIRSPASVLALLKKSKTVMIEAEMFDAGSRQWTFQTAGLKFK